MFYLSLAMSPDRLSLFMQTPVDGIYWKTFSDRMQWLIDGAIKTPDRAVAKLLEMWKNHVTAERSPQSSQSAGEKIELCFFKGSVKFLPWGQVQDH